MLRCAQNAKSAPAWGVMNWGKMSTNRDYIYAMIASYFFVVPLWFFVNLGAEGLEVLPFTLILGAPVALIGAGIGFRSYEYFYLKLKASSEVKILVSGLLSAVVTGFLPFTISLIVHGGMDWMSLSVYASIFLVLPVLIAIPGSMILIYRERCS